MTDQPFMLPEPVPTTPRRDTRDVGVIVREIVETFLDDHAYQVVGVAKRAGQEPGDATAELVDAMAAALQRERDARLQAEQDNERNLMADVTRAEAAEAEITRLLGLLLASEASAISEAETLRARIVRAEEERDQWEAEARSATAAIQRQITLTETLTARIAAVEGERDQWQQRAKERRRQPDARHECDLCQAPLVGDAYEEVETGWSVACRACLDRIREPVRARLAPPPEPTCACGHGDRRCTAPVKFEGNLCDPCSRGAHAGAADDVIPVSPERPTLNVPGPVPILPPRTPHVDLTLIGHRPPTDAEREYGMSLEADAERSLRPPTPPSNSESCV